MASFWCYFSVLIIASMATLVSPVSPSKRSNDEDIGVTPIKLSTNESSEIPLTSLSATTFERYLRGISTGTDGNNRIGTTILNKETTEYLTRETRAARSRSRGRSLNSRSSKRTSSGKSTTTVNGRHTTTPSRQRSSSRSSKGSPPASGASGSSSSSGQRVPDPTRRGSSSSSSSLTCDDVSCGSDPPGLLNVVRGMLSQLYRVLSDILQNEFSPPDPVRDDDLFTMINFLNTNGGDRGRRFLREVAQRYRKLGSLWEQCCQTYVVGRRRRAAMESDSPVDFGELILALITYDVDR